MFQIKKESEIFGTICEILICIGFILGFIYFCMNSAELQSFFPCFVSLGTWMFTASLLIAVVYALLSWYQNNRTLPQFQISFPLQENRIVILLLTCSVCLSLIPVFYAWSSGSFQINNIGQIVPVYDGGAYYNGAEKILFTGQLDSWNQRRPLNSLFLATRLLITDLNFRFSILFQAALFGISAFLAAYAVARTHGKTAGLVFFSVLFGLTGYFLPQVLSESLGIILGSLSFALVWCGIFKKKQIPFFLGVFLLTFALSARAGPMLVLVFFVLYSGYLFKKDDMYNGRAAITAMLIIIFGFLIIQSLIWVFGDGNGMVMSNFAYTLYGLAAGGKGWTQYQVDFPTLNGTETHMSSFVYEQSFILIGQDPIRFIMTLLSKLVTEPVNVLKNCIQLLVRGNYDAYNDDISLIIFGIIFIFIIAGFLRYLLSGKNHVVSYFFIGILIAIVLSLPFFYADGGFRTLAVIFPIIAACVALGTIGWRSNPRIDKKNPQRSFNYVNIVSIIGISIIVVSCLIPVFGPPVLKDRLANTQQEVYPSIFKHSDESFLMVIDPGMPYIEIRNIPDHSITFAPVIMRSDFSVPGWLKDNYNFSRYPDDLSHPLLLRGYDLITNETVLILGPRDLMPEKREIVSFNASLTSHESFGSYRVYESS